VHARAEVAFRELVAAHARGNGGSAFAALLVALLRCRQVGAGRESPTHDAFACCAEDARNASA
jgi:hypothetical protein